jgi:hypothetical protein
VEEQRIMDEAKKQVENKYKQNWHGI